MRESHGKGLANHIDPESCAGHGKRPQSYILILSRGLTSNTQGKSRMR